MSKLQIPMYRDRAGERGTTHSPMYRGVILVDRGFISGPLFFSWKKQGLDVVVPLKRNMNLLEDMQGLARLEKGLEVRLVEDKGKETVIKAFSDLTSLDSYPGMLSGLSR